jgi:hypothetical protein
MYILMLILSTLKIHCIYIDEGSMDFDCRQAFNVDKIQQTSMSLCVNV